VDVFGRSIPKVIPLDLSGNQFEIYNKFSRNYTHTFLFESLTGPEELSETSIMGFDPKIIVKGYSDKITLHYKDGTQKTIKTNEPLLALKEIMQTNSDVSYRFLGGAVGIINYDAVTLWEKVPQSHEIEYPLMEFGIYEDGILFDNKKNKSFYFYYDENRINEIKLSEDDFDKFEMSNIASNLNEDNFENIVNQAKKYIHDGDIFQVVLSRRFSFDAKGDFLKVYKKLRGLNPSPYLYHKKNYF